MLISYPFRFLISNIRRKFNVPSAPFLINYSVTFRCNLDCQYCGVSRLENNYAQAELTPGDISSFLQDEKLQKLDVVAITGGEPFVKDDLVEIMLVFQKMVSPRIFHITTNGYLTERIVEAIGLLKAKGLNIDLKVSIDDIASRHDLLRGREGSFKNAVNTIQKLRNGFNRRQLFIGINQTIFEDNYRSIPQVRKLAQELDSVYRGFVGLQKRPLYTGITERDYRLTDLSDDAKEFTKQQLKNHRLRKSIFTNGYNFLEDIVIHHYIKGQIRLLDNNRINGYRCMNLFTHFRLNPNGDIITCSYDLDVLGNIKNENYTTLLKKDITIAKLKQVKGCKECWLGCEVSPSWVSSLCTF